MFTKNARCVFQHLPLWRTFERDFNFTWQLLGKKNVFNVESCEERCLCFSLDVHVKMPSLSPTMTSGTVVKWLKKEGNR